MALQDRRRRREGDTAAAERLVAYLGGGPDESVEPIIRACSPSCSSRTSPRSASACAAPAVRRDRRVQRESLAETAEILRAQRGRHRAAGRPAADRARADRAPDRGHAALSARPPVGRRGAAGPPRRPAHRPSRRRALLDELREVLTIWWQTDELRRDPPAGRGRGAAHPVLLRGRPVRRRPGRAGRDRALARRPARAARAVLRQLDRRRHGRPPGGRRRHARARAAAAPHHRAAAFRARVDRLARMFSHSSLRIPVSEELNASLEPTPPSCPPPTSCAARTANGSRCGPSSASSTTGSATR